MNKQAKFSKYLLHTIFINLIVLVLKQLFKNPFEVQLNANLDHGHGSIGYTLLSFVIHFQTSPRDHGDPP